MPVVRSNARGEIEVVVVDSRRQRCSLTKTLKRRDSMSRMHQVRPSEKGRCPGPGAQCNRDGGNAREMYKLACDPREGKKGKFLDTILTQSKSTDVSNGQKGLVAFSGVAPLRQSRLYGINDM